MVPVRANISRQNENTSYESVAQATQKIQVDPSNIYLVRISTPFSVINTVCSKVADQPPVFDTRDQPSSQYTSVGSSPSITVGSTIIEIGQIIIKTIIPNFAAIHTYGEHHAGPHPARKGIVHVNNVWWLVECSSYAVSCDYRRYLTLMLHCDRTAIY